MAGWRPGCPSRGREEGGSVSAPFSARKAVARRLSGPGESRCGRGLGARAGRRPPSCLENKGPGAGPRGRPLLLLPAEGPGPRGAAVGSTSLTRARWEESTTLLFPGREKRGGGSCCHVVALVFRLPGGSRCAPLSLPPASSHMPVVGRGPEGWTERACCEACGAAGSSLSGSSPGGKDDCSRHVSRNAAYVKSWAFCHGAQCSVCKGGRVWSFEKIPS